MITMNKRTTNTLYPSRNNKSPFWGIYFPLILSLLICIYTGVLLFTLGSGNSLALDKWVSISLTVIAFLLFIPGILLLLILVSMILLIGKMDHYLKTGVFKLQNLIEKFSNLLLKLSRITMLPFTFLEILGQDINKKKNISIKEYVDE
jgi:hypothetical protein